MVATVLALLIAQLGLPAGSNAAARDPIPQAVPTAFPSIDQVANEPASIEQLQQQWVVAPTASNSANQNAPTFFNQANPFLLSGFQQPVVEELPSALQLEPLPNTIDAPSAAILNEPITVLAESSPIVEFAEGTKATASHQSASIARRGRVVRFFSRHTGPDLGIGFERVMFAPMVLDTAVTSPYVGVRVRADYGLSSPDRLEYIWAKAGRGPAPETRLDLIDTVYRTELGSSQAALISELSMRALNPEQNGNTVGFGDMVLGGKAIVYDGKATKVSSIFLTYLKTGSPSRGLGTGHVSLEPGLLLRHKLNEATYFHSEVKYCLPIAASAGFGGDVLSTGYALSTVWRDSDQFALIPTLEVKTTSFLFGSQTRSDGIVQRVNGVTAVDIFPGMRTVFSKSNLGTWEAGMAAGATCCDSEWFDSRFVVDLRWLW